jgi:hypothetical protein
MAEEEGECRGISKNSSVLVSGGLDKCTGDHISKSHPLADRGPT